MRILLLSMARTRSSVLIDALSKKHNIPNFYEMYKTVSPDDVSKLILFKKPDLLWDRFKKETKIKTQEIIDNNSSYAIKLFPINIFNDYQYNPQYTKNSNWNINKDSMLDLEEYFQISQYDQIYLLQRENVCDMICSYMHAYTTKFFLTDDSNKAKTMHPKGKVSLVASKYYTVKCFILYQRYLQYIKLYLDKNNIAYTKLQYDDIPKFIADNASDVKLDTVDTNYDYRKAFSNYDEIHELVSEIQKEVDREFPNTIF